MYLHDNCTESIIHCDIKSETILLDVDFCLKLADFGLAKLLGLEFSRVLTTMRGIMGYPALEWILGVPITPKADVYSFATQVIEGADVLKLLDKKLNGNANLEELSSVCKLAWWCIQDDEIQRPSMGQVVQILEGVLDVSLPPIPQFL
ncbi:hypothetical protein PTKIN_Ptkin10aG0079100 [Pterospermum kingtungense]